MNAYFDTGVLVKAYVSEPDSERADALIKRSAPPIPLTHLQALEIRNSLRLKRGRSEITEAQLKGALLNLRADVEAGPAGSRHRSMS